MALFNKLFTSRSKQDNNVSDKQFAFTSDQVRVVLFRECDFRGRKLLFDSTTIRKIPLSTCADDSLSKKEQNEHFAETSGGFGYLYIKPQPDFCKLSEMIFGLVAMSFRGAYFKIHNLEKPRRLMLTQVFPSPRHSNRCRTSCSSHSFHRSSSQSSEHSTKLNNSGGSSFNSISDHMSVLSTASDTLLVCRRLKTIPSSTSYKMSGSNPSIVGDSGFCGDCSCCSLGSTPHSFPATTWESQILNQGSSTSFSSGSLFRRWLRSTSNSLDHSYTSSNGSTEEFFTKPHIRSSKLGLAFIIQLTDAQEEAQEQFLMEHIALLESMMWRARQTTEMAYIRPHVFVSTLVEMSNVSSEWLMNLLSGPTLVINLWTCLSNGCDNNNSINAYRVNDDKTVDKYRSITFSASDLKNVSLDRNRSFTKSHNTLSLNQLQKSEFNFFNITKFLKNEWNSFNGKKVCSDDKYYYAEKFMKEFCELLETIDIKDTNFFISTLVTAVLTHHLGWVTTTLPSNDEESIPTFKNPFNPLWGQLSDLYGAVGNPTKMAQTVITGTDRDIVTKILNTLSYFIRCSDVERNHLIRKDIEEENKAADIICLENSCIPKENYKRYEDHLREMMNANNFLDERKINNSTFFKENIELNTLSSQSLMQEHNSFPKFENTSLSTMKTKLTRTGNVQFDTINPKRIDASRHHDLPSKENLFIDVKSSTITKNKSTKMNLSRSASSRNLKQLMDLGNESTYSGTVLTGKHSMSNITRPINQPNSGNFVDDSSEQQNNVVFVLGDNEKLVGLKCDNGLNVYKKTDIQKELTKVTKSADRPNFLDLVFKKYETFEEEFVKGNFKDEDFVKYDKGPSSIKPCSSWASLEDAVNKESHKEEPAQGKVDPGPGCSLMEKSNIRSQSVPPEDRKKIVVEEVKAKYRYCGIKFNLHQYPQVVTNYMRSKNLEMANLSFADKAMKYDQIAFENGEVNLDFSQYAIDGDQMEGLQTPSNASELEFTSDLTLDLHKEKHAKESSEEVQQPSYVRTHVPNTTVNEACYEKCCSLRKKTNCINSIEMISNLIDDQPPKMKIVSFPMPKSSIDTPKNQPVPYMVSLVKGIGEKYVPDMVLQGTTQPKVEWEFQLKNDLALASHHSLLDQRIEEAVAIAADTDSWEVQLMSSHTYVIDKGSSGIRVGMSQLVANMLESLLQMWKLHVPPQYCLMHIEQRLQELCVRSKALAQLLLATEFCSMEFLTSTLHLEVNDVPLLLAVASTHSPQVTQKYGISFQ